VPPHAAWRHRQSKLGAPDRMIEPPASMPWTNIPECEMLKRRNFLQHFLTTASKHASGKILDPRTFGCPAQSYEMLTVLLLSNSNTVDPGGARPAAGRSAPSEPLRRGRPHQATSVNQAPEWPYLSSVRNPMISRCPLKFFPCS